VDCLQGKCRGSCCGHWSFSKGRHGARGNEEPAAVWEKHVVFRGQSDQDWGGRLEGAGVATVGIVSALVKQDRRAAKLLRGWVLICPCLYRNPLGEGSALKGIGLTHGASAESTSIREILPGEGHTGAFSHDESFCRYCLHYSSDTPDLCKGCRVRNTIRSTPSCPASSSMTSTASAARHEGLSFRTGFRRSSLDTRPIPDYPTKWLLPQSSFRRGIYRNRIDRPGNGNLPQRRPFLSTAAGTLSRYLVKKSSATSRRNPIPR